MNEIPIQDYVDSLGHTQLESLIKKAKLRRDVLMLGDEIKLHVVYRGMANSRLFWPEDMEKAFSHLHELVEEERSRASDKGLDSIYFELGIDTRKFYEYETKQLIEDDLLDPRVNT